MQDGSPRTVNNMQANENEGNEEIPVTFIPGPSILNWRKVIPNSITALATCVGLSAVILGLEGHFDLAVISILVSGFLDGLDGPVARLLKGTSRFGAEFDSLSDYINFGVSPGILLYLWAFQKSGWWGWSICLAYIICMGCRLARFNAGVDFNASKLTMNFFTGVPAPAGAMLITMPIVCQIQFGNRFGEGFFQKSSIRDSLYSFCCFPAGVSNSNLFFQSYHSRKFRKGETSFLNQKLQYLHCWVEY